jgi:hypothetical protein
MQPLHRQVETRHVPQPDREGCLEGTFRWQCTDDTSLAQLLTIASVLRMAIRRSLLARNVAVLPKLRLQTTTTTTSLPSPLRRRLVARRPPTQTTKKKLPQRKPEAARRRPLLPTTTAPRRKRRPKLLRRRLEAVLASLSRPPPKTTRKSKLLRRRLGAVLASRFRPTMKSSKKRMMLRLKLKLLSRLRRRLGAVLTSLCQLISTPMPKRPSTRTNQLPHPQREAEVVPRRSRRLRLPPTVPMRRPRRAEAVLANRCERPSNRHHLDTRACSSQDVLRWPTHPLFAFA